MNTMVGGHGCIAISGLAAGQRYPLPSLRVVARAHGAAAPQTACAARCLSALSVIGAVVGSVSAGKVIVSPFMVPMWHRRNEPLSSWRASVPTRHVGVAEVLFQSAPALVRKAFTRPRVDPLARPLGRPASPALGLRA